MNAPTLEHVNETVHDVAHKAQKVAERAPDIASHVGRSARSTAETVAESVSDAVVKLAQMTPFLDAPMPRRNRARWMFRAALVVTIAGVAMWIVNRRRGGSHPWYQVDENAAPEATGTTTERRFATAGN
jgi:hypothetical protein